MINQITEKIYDTLLDNEAVEAENKQIIIYGATSIINNILHIGVSIFIGFLFNQVLNVIIFHFFYDNLRRYAGGYHAKSKSKCFIYSCVIVTASLMLWTVVPNERHSILACVLTIISFPVIFIFSPSENENKPLVKIEETGYRKKAKVWLFIIAGIVFSALLIRVEIISVVGGTALFVASLLIILGKVNLIVMHFLGGDSEMK